MRLRTDWFTATRMSFAAQMGGAVPRGAFSHEWDVSGDCIRAVTLEISERPPQAVLIRPEGDRLPVNLILHVPCRKCPPCLDRRGRTWTARAIAETSASTRTWFGTLTLEPSEQFRFLCEAIEHQKARAVEWSALSPRQQFLARHRQIGRAVTRYVKRVRKESGAKLRTLVVCEAHSSGLPHYHMLIHERGSPVSWRTLARQWQHGFSVWKLADEDAAIYVTKYLFKAAEARVRASQRYGDSQSERPEGASLH